MGREGSVRAGLHREEREGYRRGLEHARGLRVQQVRETLRLQRAEAGCEWEVVRSE